MKHLAAILAGALATLALLAFVLNQQLATL